MPGKAERIMNKQENNKMRAMAESRGFPPGTFDDGEGPGGGGGVFHGGVGSSINSMPRITFGSMPSYRDEKMIEMKHHQQQQTKVANLPPPPPPMSLPPHAAVVVANSASQTPTLYGGSRDNRKDSATSPVDPALMDTDDELLLMDDRAGVPGAGGGGARFIELSPSNLPKLSVKDKLLAAAAAAAAAGAGVHQVQVPHSRGGWASMLSQAMPPLGDLGGGGGGGGPVGTGGAATSVTTPLLQDDAVGLHHSRHSLHRQSSQVCWVVVGF